MGEVLDKLKAIPGRPARSQALDDLIMGTNSSSIVSKRSVERLYYPDEPHFFRYFVKKFQRRSPLINRGYWLRLRAIDVIVRQFLSEQSSRKKIVINLGCGYDVLPWQCHTRYPQHCENALFVDIDYPDLMRKKRTVVLETDNLRTLLGDDFTSGESADDPVLLRSENYCQLACDLRELDSVRKTLETLTPLSECDVLFVAEVSVTYMDTASADALIQWASTIGQAQFCLLEQILPHGPDHPFAQTMLSHFNKLKTPPRSVGTYRSLSSQKTRFGSRGWQSVDIWDLWQAWCDERNFFVTPAERSQLDQVEPFDEWEEFILFARHYFVIHARAQSSNPQQNSHATQSPSPTPDTVINVTFSSQATAQPSKRRFGNVIPLTNPLGEKYAMHVAGMGISGRSDTVDMYSLRSNLQPPTIPLNGPPPRVCATVTDLGAFGLLLAGGRGSPTHPFSDCWTLSKATNTWQRAPSLPRPLFRHSAIRLPASSLALVVGGKTGPCEISDEVILYDPTKGWRKCDVSGAEPQPSFGGTLCAAPEAVSRTGHFEGFLAGGMNQAGDIITEKYTWHLDVTCGPPAITFTPASIPSDTADALSSFGAETIALGSFTAVCGGVGNGPSVLGQIITTLSLRNGKWITQRCHPLQDISPADMPFMIGSSVIRDDQSLVVLGGGATCFSMGTYWEKRLWKVDFPLDQSSELFATAQKSESQTHEEIQLIESLKTICTPQQTATGHQESGSGTISDIPRVKLGQGKSFQDYLKTGKPVIIEDLQLGDCTAKWNPTYLTQRVGADKQVVVHECQRDTEKMDFNSKNFRYVTDRFGAVVSRMESGGRLYLRSLSQDKPSEAPASLEDDYPELAQDFVLPEELAFVKEHLFSSVLRVSGNVNMWLHYDVMANVYAQIHGRKRMILFPPHDVSSLSLPHGASSSSLDVFSALNTPVLSSTHAHSASLSPGDVLFLPPMWLHTATPLLETQPQSPSPGKPAPGVSVAVNVFFRSLDSGYAPGRDVYGNRDLAAYEKGRADAAKIAKSFQGLPGEIRGFYLSRIADELRELGEGSEEQ